jgi:hypothetical protein
MSPSASSTRTPAMSRVASPSPASHRLTLSDQVAVGKELQAAALTNDTDVAKVGVVATLLEGVADSQTTQTTTDRIPTTCVSFPSPPVTDEEFQVLDNGQPQSHGVDKPPRPPKRKYRTMSPDDNIVVKVPSQSRLPRPQNKKMLNQAVDDAVEENEPSPEPKKRKVSRDAMEADRIIAAEQKRLANPKNKHLIAMRKWNFIKVAKGSAQARNHATKVNALKTQVKGAAAALDPSLNSDRDIGGAKNKFDRQRTNELNEANIGAWKGSKWTDEEDPNITWFNIPVSQKTLALSGRMVPVQEILDRSVRFPEFRFVENVMVEQPKTGKQVLGFYKITYEKMNAEQASERMGVMVKQAKAEAVQRRKDEAAERKRAQGKTRRRRG